MESEGSPFGSFNPALLPLALLILAVALAGLSFAVGWFSVDTRIQVWQFDAAAPEGKGVYTGYSARVHTEMKLLSLQSNVDPDELQRVLEDTGDMPSYDRELDETGSKMLGIFLLNTVSFLSLAGATGAYLLNRRSQKDLRRGVWRFAAVFAFFAVFSLVYMAVEVPESARSDTREVLQAYKARFELDPNFPRVDDRILEPNVKFWNTWICCPCDTQQDRDERRCSVFTRPGTSQEFLVLVKTQSRPSGGFWLVATDLVLAAAALVVGVHVGHLERKRADQVRKPVPRFP